MNEVEESKDLSEVFKSLKPQSEAKFEKTIKKLNEDETKIVQKLIAKYENNYRGMQRDIKLNFMQWSKGQAKKKCETYLNHHK